MTGNSLHHAVLLVDSLSKDINVSASVQLPDTEVRPASSKDKVETEGSRSARFPNALLMEASPITENSPSVVAVVVVV